MLTRVSSLHSLSRLCCALETVVWRHYAERIGQRSNVRINHRRPGGGARSLPTKHPKGAKYPELSRFFFETRSVVPGRFLNWDLDSDRGIGLKRCALRKSAAVRDNRREQGLLRRRASMLRCRRPKSASTLLAGVLFLRTHDVI